MRGDQMSRQWRIIKLIEAHANGIGAAELAKEVEVPIRTLYRDLEAIQRGGFPIFVEKRGKFSYWKMVDTFKKLLPLPLTPTELMALHTSRDLLKVFNGTIFQESIESLFEKVRTLLQPDKLNFADDVSSTLKIDFGPTRSFLGLTDTINQLSEATINKKRVKIDYNAISTGSQTVRKVDPYRVWVMNGSFYLIGHCHKRQALRTFSLDRIQKLTVLKETFRISKDIDIDAYLRSAFRVMTGEPQKVLIKISPNAAHVVRERIWHTTQHVTDLPDGSVNLSLQVPINYEIISWILGFGSAAEVIQPHSLRDRILNEHEKAAMNYENLTKRSSRNKK
ncbi:MAG: helix-turn-helix transcriptional regulator [Desulfomonilaceae bacterium]